MRPIPTLLCLALSLPLFAAEHSREEMETMIQEQESRVDALSREFFALDEQIEQRIQNVIDTLAKLEDSADSKTRISNLKSKVLDDLKSSIRAMQQRRNAIAAMRPELQNQEAKDFLAGKMEKRVDQILELSASLHESKNLQEYEYVIEEDFKGDLKQSRKKSEEWKADRKQTINADQDRGDLIEAIEKEERRLTQEINHLKAESGDTPAPATAEKIRDLEGLRDTLLAKKQEVLEGNKTETEAVDSTAEAMELERQVSLAVNQLRAANGQLRQKGQELQQAMARLDAQRKVLEADAGE